MEANLDGFQAIFLTCLEIGADLEEEASHPPGLGVNMPKIQTSTTYAISR